MDRVQDCACARGVKVTVEVRVEVRVDSPYVVLRRLKLGPVGRKGRGKPDYENLWAETVRYAVETGAMIRPPTEHEFMMDDFSVHYKTINSDGKGKVADAVRTAVCLVRQAVYCHVWPLCSDGTVRAKGEVQREVKAYIARTGLVIPRKPRRPKNGW